MHELVGRCYEAALDSRLWTPTLQALGEWLGGASLIMSALDRDEGTLFAACSGVDPASFAIVAERFRNAATNQLVAAMPDLPIGVPVARKYIESDAVYLRSDLYNQAFRPQGLVHQAVACLVRSERVTAPIGLLKPLSRGTLTSQEMQVLEIVLPHLRRAVQIALRLGASESLLQLSLAGLERIALGVALINGHGHALHLNGAAERIVARHDGLDLQQRLFSALRRQDSVKLRRAIERVLTAPQSGAVAVQVQRPVGRPYALIVVPLRPAAGRPVLPQAGAMLLMGDPEQNSGDLVEHLRALFELSSGEARLALALFDGQGLQDVADERGVSINTVKTELKRIFAKTGTHGQGELMRVLRAIPATAA